MEALLARIGLRAVDFAIKSGITFTSSVILKQSTRLLKTIDDKVVRSELRSLQKQLQSKIKVRPGPLRRHFHLPLRCPASPIRPR